MTMTTPGDFSVPLAEQLLNEVRVEIARADSKAALLVAALGLGTGLFGGMVANGGWSPGALSTLGQVLWWLGLAALFLALTAFLLAVAPRLPGGWVPGEPLTYFGDIDRAARRGELREALAATGGAPRDRLAKALAANSRIATGKLRWVRFGLVTSGLGIVLLPVALLAG
ncbi:hypothetical protein SAMN06297387_109188 [Streptomyces zhaozhouensis]|uniref:Pycsar effector protein domain-containing protein n=1 Tax=Streptomyces zhaozhouensis TaxID=1300267 RepID=A0A286DX49_9ACTN|nr:Pycsar system effector family protein [Streptomyces zhaozhouensis]SOD63245.1 hypothetical protein SAMN06297387_109188 [Streptomyces zhaozhouensis]